MAWCAMKVCPYSDSRDFLKMVDSAGLSWSCGSLPCILNLSVLSLLICSVLSEQCSASLWCCFSSPHSPPQSLPIQGEPQGIQWQLNTFLWIDFKALFPLGPSGTGSEGRRGKQEEAVACNPPHCCTWQSIIPSVLTTRNSSWLWSVQVLYAGAKAPARSLLPGRSIIAAGDELSNVA